MLDFISHQENANQNTVKYYVSPIRMAIITKTYNKCCGDGGGIGLFMHCWWECYTVQLL